MLKKLGKPFELACLLFIAAGAILSPGCTESQQTTKKKLPPVLDQKRFSDMVQGRGAPDHSPPKPDEVKEAVLRVFKDAVIIETNRNPYFVAGDFNGDLSTDLAVVAKPMPIRLSEINDELANWILVDPVQPLMSGQNVTPHPEIHVKRRRVQVAEGDVLLAVIHGYGPKGWRDPWATQTYVLRGADGNEMKTQVYKQVMKAGNKEKLPRLWGDVIAQTIGGRSGFFYYNGARYAWYDPLSYKPAPPARMAHGMASAAMR